MSGAIILYGSPEAAQQVTVTGWRSRNGIFYGNDEHIARWAGCTHIACPECGSFTSKRYTHCDACRDKRRGERYSALPREIWDESTPVCTFEGDQYFFDLDSLIDHCHDNDCRPEDLQLVICEPVMLQQINEEFWRDDLPDDGELPDAIHIALDALNKAIQENTEPVAYRAGKVAAVIHMEAA